MKPRTSREGTDPVPGRRRGMPALLLQTLLVVAVALPAGIAIAPAFLGPDGSSDASQTAPPWQQIPATLSPPGNSSGGSRAPQHFRARSGRGRPRRAAQQDP